MMVVDEGGRIRLANHQILELFGYKRVELVGQPIEMLLPDNLRGAHRAHRARFRAEPRTRTMGSGSALLGRRADGAMFPVEISLSPLRTDEGLGVIAAVRDISARVAAETEAARVRKILDDISDAILMFERDTLLFTYVNHGAVAQLGYSQTELLSMGPLDIKPLFSEGEYRELIESLSPGESRIYTTVHRRKDGTDIPVEAVVQHAPDDLGGGSGWMVSIARDLTARLEIEQRAMAVEREMTLLEDRERIARDLHDRVIQRLFAAGLGIESLRAQTSNVRISGRLGHVVEELDETIRDLRSSIFQLTLTSSTDSSRAMITRVCAEEREALGFDPILYIDGPVDSISDASADHLLAVLREALSNVAHHAQATKVHVAVFVGRDLVLLVKDDGIGLLAGARYGAGNGLANMAARAQKLEGVCHVTPGTPSGTNLEWRVPFVERTKA